MTDIDMKVTTIRIRKDLWEEFLRKVYQENGRTHGGVIRRTIERLIGEYTKT